jgi:fatty-acyl-CoA synthase
VITSTMQDDFQLTVPAMLRHGEQVYGRSEVLTWTGSDAGPRRVTFADIGRNARRLAGALVDLGVGPGDRVGTLAWNTHRHLALYYGVSGSGAVLHTVNPRLFPEQIDYIVNHAEDKVLFFDTSFAPLVEKLAPALKSVRAFIAMTDRAHMPVIDVPHLLCYEELVGAQSEAYEWPEFDERTASSLCYTSGTTGNPKGVLYSHRSTVLHSLMECAPDTFGVNSQMTLLLAVPMFHANAWGMPYAAAMAGAKLVMPGPHMDAQSLYELMRDEKVGFSQAVPTIWLMLFQYFDAHPEIDTRAIGLKRIGVGGAATPRSMIERFERDFGADFVQGWGMTETSPIGVIGNLLPKHLALPKEEQTIVKMKQGRGVWGVELKIVGEDGRRLPHDGKAFGHLHVRGPWIASGYFKGEGGSVLDAEGFFPTGDVATVDADGYVTLVDRAKDVIKSGGEWISSIDLENAASAHPAVAEAAVIGVAHPKWQERPLLIVVKRAGAEVTCEELLTFLAGRVAKWWLPDDVVFVDSLPHTATGKLLKTKLREQFKGYVAATSV